MSRETATADPAFETVGSYSPAVVAGGFAHVCGQGLVGPVTGSVPDRFREQSGQALGSLRAVQEASRSWMEDAAKANACLTGIAPFARFAGVYEGFFGGGPPVRAASAATLPAGDRA